MRLPQKEPNNFSMRNEMLGSSMKVFDPVRYDREGCFLSPCLAHSSPIDYPRDLRGKLYQEFPRMSSSAAAARSDDYGFLVFAEEASEGVGDFADGGVGFDGGEDGGEKIFGGGGAALEFG